MAAGFAGAANATFYTNRAAWQAAVTGQTTIGFEGIAANNSFVFQPSGISLGGVNFALGPDSNGYMYVMGPNFYYPGNAILSSQQSATGIDSLVITLPGLFGAVGVDFGSLTAQVFTFTDLTPGHSGGNVTSGGPATPSLTFFGYIADTPGDDPLSIIKISVAGQVGSRSNALNIDNFSFASPVRNTGVPEPLTLSLFGAGVAGAVAMRRRKKA
jgi:hypothetical protein